MSNPYPHLCPYASAVEGGLRCECPPIPDSAPADSHIEPKQLISKVDQMRYLQSLVEGYKNNPSNSNKYLTSIYAIVFDDDWYGIEEWLESNS